jgi:hypothetical protein
MRAQFAVVRGIEHETIYMQSYAWCLQLKKHPMRAIVLRYVMQRCYEICRPQYADTLNGTEGNCESHITVILGCCRLGVERGLSY